jgi:low affinity Fe/Cu permease
MDISRLFGRFATKTARATGSPWAFILCIIVVVVWAVSGPVFHYSDTWQLVINTGTTIITFLMVFLIQNTQNRDGAAIQAKLDDLILTSRADNEFIGIESAAPTRRRPATPSWRGSRLSTSSAAQNPPPLEIKSRTNPRPNLESLPPKPSGALPKAPVRCPSKGSRASFRASGWGGIGGRVAEARTWTVGAPPGGCSCPLPAGCDRPSADCRGRRR